MAHKVYRGRSEGNDTAADVHVWVTAEDGSIQPLKHQVRHSPTGFNWGYAGSGPADLARSILADHLGHIPHPTLYQDFKNSLVAVWPAASPWELTSAAIQAWIEGNTPRQLAAQLCGDCGGLLLGVVNAMGERQCECEEMLRRAGQGRT